MDSILQHKKFAEAVKRSYAEHPEWWLDEGCSEPSDFLKFFLEWSFENELDLINYMIVKKRNEK